MSPAVLARNFVIGGALAAGYTLFRSTVRTMRNGNAPRILLDPHPQYVESMAPELMVAFRDISACCARARSTDFGDPADDARLPEWDNTTVGNRATVEVAMRDAYKRNVRRAIQAVDDLFCIEVQLQRGELGEPSPRDATEAQRLALRAMTALRRVEPSLAWSDFWYGHVRGSVDRVQSVINVHLDNITKYVYERV